MTYIDQSLGDNETLRYRARFPAIRYWAAYLALGLFLLVAYVALQRGATYSAMALALAGLAAIGAILFQVWTTEIAVTDQRLIHKRGFLRRMTSDLQLRAIEEVCIHQDILGRIFNYGRIVFHGTGVDDLELPTLADPVAIQKAVQESMGAQKPSAAGYDATVAPSARGSVRS